MAGTGHTRHIEIGKDPATGEPVVVDATQVLGSYTITFGTLVLTEEGEWIPQSHRRTRDVVLFENLPDALKVARRSLR